MPPEIRFDGLTPDDINWVQEQALTDKVGVIRALQLAHAEAPPMSPRADSIQKLVVLIGSGSVAAAVLQEEMG